MIGQQLDKDSVRRLAIEDDNTFDALFQGIDAGLDLGDHAAANRSIRNERTDLVDPQFLDQMLVPIEHAGDIGQE